MPWSTYHAANSLKRSSARASRPFSEPVGASYQCASLFVAVFLAAALFIFRAVRLAMQSPERLPRVAIVYRLGEAVQPFGIISSMLVLPSSLAADLRNGRIRTGRPAQQSRHLHRRPDAAASRRNAARV